MDDNKLPNVKQVFGTIAKDYAQFRPRYPPQLFSFLSSLTPQHDLAWDVGTGTGQAASELSKFYSRVVATDTSEGQIRHAEQRPNITYAVTPPSMTAQQLQSIVSPDSSVDLVTVATAVHYFDLDEFYPQVKRVLKKPGGVIAVWSYWKPIVDPAVDAVFKRFFDRTLPLFRPAAKLVLEEYETLPFPFEAVEGIKVEIEEQWSFEQYFGMLGTASGLVGREDILDEFRADFEAAWGAPLHVTKVVKFPLCLKLSKYYARVVATDTSEGQIQHAEHRPNITYAVTPPSMTDQQLQSIVGPDSSVDLVTVATAVHWFDLDEFYPQVKRVLKKPGGVIAVWAYCKPTVDPAVDAVYERFFCRTSPLIRPAAKLVLEEYETLPFPFEAVEGIKVEIEEHRNFDQYFGMLGTRHALVGREEILEEFRADFEAAWGAPLHVTRAVKFPLCLRVGKV